MKRDGESFIFCPGGYLGSCFLSCSFLLLHLFFDHDREVWGLGGFELFGPCTFAATGFFFT